MLIKYFCLLLLSVLGAPTLVSAQTKTDCPGTKNYQKVHDFEGYAVQLLPARKVAGHEEDRCLGTVTPAKGIRKTVAKDWGLSVDSISGSDINGDGKPEVVFDGHTTGAHCCFDYWIVTLAKPVQTIGELHNQVPIDFQKRSDGGVEIRTGDGEFDYFLVPHNQAVIPQLILRLDGNKFTDISSQYQPEYDEDIAKARSQLTPADLDKFRQSRYNEKMFSDQLPTVGRTLRIVLDYLYSGREQKAWEALQQMWPESDQNRTKALILERRSRGLLKQIADHNAKSTL